jgi:steroid delta-isomerase-like uncharacterized protein
MVSPDGTPGFADREHPSASRQEVPQTPTPADRPAAGRASSGVTGDETTEVGQLATAAANAALARRQAERFNARDFDAYESALAEDVEVVLVPFETMLHGSRTARDHVASHAVAFPDTVIEVRKVLADATGATIEFVAHGTHTGPLLMPTGTIEPTGQSADVHYCFVYEIEQGRIQCIHQYFDAATMMRQLGYER